MATTLSVICMPALLNGCLDEIAHGNCTGLSLSRFREKHGQATLGNLHPTCICCIALGLSLRGDHLLFFLLHCDEMVVSSSFLSFFCFSVSPPPPVCRIHKSFSLFCAENPEILTWFCRVEDLEWNRKCSEIFSLYCWNNDTLAPILFLMWILFCFFFFLYLITLIHCYLAWYLFYFQFNKFVICFSTLIYFYSILLLLNYYVF